MRNNWKPSKAAAQEYAAEIQEIKTFCEAHSIHASRTLDSYYFTIGGIEYRVSNHSIDASDNAAFDEITGEQRRALYHANDDAATVQIRAGKTRIIQIYNDLCAGYQLDRKGNRI